MKHEHFSIEIRGILPTQSLQSMLKQVSERIHWQSPSDSFLKIFCEQSKEAMKASCRIASQAGVFVAEAISESPEERLRNLEKRIYEQLNTWKETRFTEFTPVLP